MIAEAVDTARTLAVALLVWIAVGSAVATAAVYAVAVGVWWAARTVTRSVKAACAWLSWRVSAFEGPEVIPEGREIPGPVEARTEPHAPAWARKDAA